MSLTRNQWLKMWASAKLLEANNIAIHDFAMRTAQSPFHKQSLFRMITRNKYEIDQIKRLIESVIGQME